MSRVKEITLAGVAADPNGLFTDVSTSGELTILAAGAALDPPRKVQLDSGATDNSADTARITGTDRYGNVITEDLVCPGAAALTLSVKVYASVTSINLLSAVVNLEGGWGNSTQSQWVPVDTYVSPFELMATIIIASGTVDCTVELTNEDMQFDSLEGGDRVMRTEEVVADDLHDGPAAITTITATAVAALVAPVTAVRLLINSWTSGTPRLRLVQARARV